MCTHGRARKHGGRFASRIRERGGPPARFWHGRFSRLSSATCHQCGLAGGTVLQSLADLFRTFFRATDICCRYGGEEFAIILPESSSQDAARRADALRAEVKRLRLQYKKQTLGPLTLSAGVAAFPEHSSS